MDFPRLVFVSPGTTPCNGGTYTAQVVRNESELKAALKAGYAATLPEALNPSKVEKVEEPEALKPSKPVALKTKFSV